MEGMQVFDASTPLSTTTAAPFLSGTKLLSASRVPRLAGRWSTLWHYVILGRTPTWTWRVYVKAPPEALTIGPVTVSLSYPKGK